jgi:hypothetical protein
VYLDENMQKDFPKSTLHCQKHMAAYSSNGNQERRRRKRTKISSSFEILVNFSPQSFPFLVLLPDSSWQVMTILGKLNR